MATAAVTEKMVKELRKVIEELHRQQCEITDRLHDPHILRRANCAPRSNGPDVGPVLHLRSFVRPTPVPEDQSALKKHLLSAVVKVDNREAKLEMSDTTKEQNLVVEGKPIPVTVETHSVWPRAFIPSANGGVVRNDSYTHGRREFDLPLPELLLRMLLKDEILAEEVLNNGHSQLPEFPAMMTASPLKTMPEPTLPELKGVKQHVMKAEGRL